jgi:DNA ligase-1
MRLGANRISVLQAFGYATYLHHRFGPRKISTAEESAISKEDWNWAGSSVKRCFSLRPDLTTLLKCLIQGGIEKMLQECTLRPGLPVQPMLGQISRGIGHAVKQFNGAFLAEFKYDGMRAQIHVTQDEMKVFSRKNEDKTGQMPDVVRIAREKLASSVESAVMDTECVAIDRSTGRFKSFQELSTRSRSDIDESEINVAIAIYVFDMMYLNGESLVDRPLAERRSFAKASLHHAANEMQLAESEEISEDTPQEECEDKVTSLLHSSLTQQGEGLMLKKLNQPGALYEPGRRSESWMKARITIWNVSLTGTAFVTSSLFSF